MKTFALSSCVVFCLLLSVACTEKKAPEATTVTLKTTSDKASSALNADAEPALPGLEGDQVLMASLNRLLKNKKTNYQPRTHHFNQDGTPRFINRLIGESSPYLLQHAHNPVNWRPWGEDAFKRARALGRPILLSVGYSTCHWCHVMERESFEDLEIAEFINKHFIAIKVDREERPDVDDLYMGAVHLLRGRGGWPMTVLMTPGKKPFFAGTYFPARDGDRGARKGFLTILMELQARFVNDQENLLKHAERITQRLRTQAEPRPPGAVPTADALHRAFAAIEPRFDPVWGGFGRRPKFPRPVTLDYLLRYHRRTGNEHALKMVNLTLEKMAWGGLHDQVGGGFHRYATDEQWLVPHFEKMLYDNAQLILIYLDAWLVTGRPEFSQTARKTLDYILREMTHPSGPFYSATDADSVTPSGHREEGWFFTWTPSEVEAIVGATGLELLTKIYGFSDSGNFEGRNIPFLERSIASSASSLQREPKGLNEEVTRLNQALYEARSKRPQPLLDDKILTSWNGLMIAAFARAGRVLKQAEYTEAATRAARFILSHLRRPNGRLLRTWRDGEAKLNAYLDDYAFLIAGLIELYESSGSDEWLRAAITLQTTLDEHYWDALGGYFSTSDDHEVLLTREKPIYDGAEPSGNAIAAQNLLRLHTLTTQSSYLQKADAVFAAFSLGLSKGSTGQPAMLSALEMRLDRPLQIVVVTRSSTGDSPLEDVIRSQYLPNRGLIMGSSEALRGQRELVPLVDGKNTIDGRPTAYVCREGRCEKPTNNPAVLALQLRETTPLKATLKESD